MILLVGSDEGLLEGLAQVLCRLTRVVTSPSLDAVREQWPEARPSLVVIEGAELANWSGPLPPLSDRGGLPVVTFHAADSPRTHPLAPQLARLVVADLELPLERHRLVAIAEHLLDRARSAGRENHTDPSPRPHAE